MITQSEASTYGSPGGISSGNYNAVAAATDGLIRSVVINRHNSVFTTHDTIGGRTTGTNPFSVASDGSGEVVRVYSENGTGHIVVDKLVVESNTQSSLNSWSTVNAVASDGVVGGPVKIVYENSAYKIFYVKASNGRVRVITSTDHAVSWSAADYSTTDITVAGSRTITNLSYGGPVPAALGGGGTETVYYIYNATGTDVYVLAGLTNAGTAYLTDFIWNNGPINGMDCQFWIDPQQTNSGATRDHPELKHIIVMSVSLPNSIVYDSTSGTPVATNVPSGGIISFVAMPPSADIPGITLGQWQPVQKFDLTSSIQYRSTLHLSPASDRYATSVSHDIFWACSMGSDGDSNTTDTSVGYNAIFYYSSKDGRNWSRENIVPSDASIPAFSHYSNGVQIVKCGNYVYICSHDVTLRSPLAGEFSPNEGTGSSTLVHPDLTMDVSSYVIDYQSTAGDVRQTAITLDNRNNIIGKTFIGSPGTLELITYLGHIEGGTAYKFQVALEDVDSVQFTRQIPTETCQITARDRSGWMTDKFENQDAIYFDNIIASTDFFIPLTNGDTTTGISHTAAISGTWATGTPGQVLYASSKYVESVAFNTFAPNIQDGTVEIDFILPTASTRDPGESAYNDSQTPTRGGIVFRGIDANNFFYVYYDFFAQVVNVNCRLLGVDYNIFSTAPSTYFKTTANAEGSVTIRIEFWGAEVFIYTIDSDLRTHEIIGGSLPQLLGGNPTPGQGYIGFYAKAFSDGTPSHSATFSRMTMNNNADAVNLERVYKKYAALAGVHDCEFTDNISGFDPAKWTTVTNFVYSGQTMSLSATSPGTDTNIWYSDGFPHSYTVEFSFYKGYFQALLRGNGGTTYYKVTYDGALYISAFSVVAGTPHAIPCPKGLSTNITKISKGRVRIECYDAQWSSDSIARTLTVCIWLNDKLLYTFNDSIVAATPLQFGLVVTASTTSGVVYSDFRVGNLGEPIQLSSNDPGEHPMDAITRAIEDRYIRQWFRWNGHLKAYIPTARASVLTLPITQEFQLSPALDYRQAFSHVRLLGAFQWVQATDTALVQQLGNRFTEINNTAAWNTDQIVSIINLMFTRAKEEMQKATFQTKGMIFNEIEDHIQLPDPSNPGSYIDYIIDELDWSNAPSTLDVTVQARRYSY